MLVKLSIQELAKILTLYVKILIHKKLHDYKQEFIIKEERRVSYSHNTLYKRTA